MKIAMPMIALLLSLLFSPLTAQTLKLATIAPEGSTWMKVLKDMDRDIKRRTKGKVKFKFFPGAIKGDEKTVLKQMKFGAVDAAGFASLGMGEITGEVRALDLPLLLRTDQEVDLLYDKMFDRFSAIFDTKGYVLLGFSDIGFVHFFSNVRISTKPDLKKTKCWVWTGDQVAETALKRLGVSPIPLAVADVFTSLQTGVIDTFYSPPLGAVAMQWFSKVKYFQEFPLTHSTGGLVVTNKAFRRIKPPDQEMLRKVARRHMRRLVKASRKENKEAIAALKKVGLQFIPKPGIAELAQYEAIGMQIRDELAGKVYSKATLQEVLALLAEHRKGNKE